MAITVRIGNENDFKPAKLLPGEPAASLDTPKFRIGIGSGKYLELATIQELQNILDASQEEYEAFQNFVDYLRENPNAYDAIVAEIDALPEKYVQLTDYKGLEEGADLHELDPGNYRISSSAASSILNTPIPNIGISYVNVYDDGTIKNIVVRQRGSGRMWWQSYSGSWGAWIEYTRNEEIADKTKLTQYINWTDLGVPVTSDYATIVNAMINNSVAILPVNSTDNNPNHPTQYGTLEILKTNFGPVHFTFTRPYNGFFDKWCGTYRTNLGFSGWKEVTFQEEIEDKTKLTQYTSWTDLGLKEGEATMEQIFNAMAAQSMAVLTKSSTTTQGELPNNVGILTVVKNGNYRSTFEFASNGSSGYIRRWVGGYDNNITPKFTGWQEITFATETLNEQTLNSVAKLARMQANTLNDDQAKEVKELYDTWESGKEYKAGDRVNYIRNLYRVLQDHTSQEGWEPNQTPALFTAITIYDDNIELWTQPSGSTDAYQKGDKVLYNDIEWESTVDNNVWEPGVYGWEQIEN